MMLSSPSTGRTRMGHCVHRSSPVHHSRLRCRATENAAVPTEKATDSEAAIETLKQAAGKIKSIEKVSSKEAFKSLRLLEKSKLKGDWGQSIGCDQYWRLVYTANSQAMRANDQNPDDGTGFYFPACATNKLAPDSDGSVTGEMKTATYLPHIAAVEFSGKYNMKGKLTNFDMTEVKLKLGPFLLGPFSIPSQVKDGKGPFFNFFYADEDIACAIGRGGGIAMWAKAEPTFIAEKGIVL